MTTVLVFQEKLQRLCQRKLENAGISVKDVTMIADVLVHANLRCVNSHGVMRTENYVTRVINLEPTSYLSID